MLAERELEPSPLPPPAISCVEAFGSDGPEYANKYYRARYYDPRIGRFISEDPIGLFGGINMYAYANANATNFVDPSGLDAQVLVGGPYAGHSYGHVALRVFGNGYDMTYDFGRYGATWGLGGSAGEGQLRVWSDFDAYIAGENATGRTTTGYTYKTSAEQDAAVMAYYAGLIKGIKPNQSRTNMNQYRIGDYDAANKNCTTVAMDGLGVALPGLASSITDPRYNKARGLSFTERLAMAAAQNGSRVVLPLDLEQGMIGQGGYTGKATYRR
jgi:hypothetical protein